MGVLIISDGGLPVTLDTRMWSFDPTVTRYAADAYRGSELADPISVWKTQRSVRTVVGFLARNIAQVALHGFEVDEEGDRRRLPVADALSRLLRRPSKTATGYEHMHTLVVDVCMWDRYAAVIVEGADGTVELQRLPPARWTFTRDVFDQPTGIRLVDGKGGHHDIPLGSALWIDGYPLPEGAMATPIAALQDLLAEERESSRYRRELWESGARMPGWIERPADAPEWSKLARTKFRAGWQEYASGGGRVGRTPILEDGMTYHEMNGGITPENAQQLETRKFSIAETAASFFVPPVFVGVLDGANYSNVVAYREILYSDTLGTWFQQLQQAYNSRLLTHPLVGRDDGVFVEFNVAEKLRMSFDEQTRIFQTATGAPFMTRNEARRRVNLPSIDGADELVVPLNVLTGGQASPTDSAPEGAR